MRLKPFFSYYGAKWRVAPKYPKPRHARIVEPFAGAAGYSICHASRDVQLWDANPIIVGVWDYLIRVRRCDFIRLPTYFENVDDLRCCQEAKWLIGFWLNAANANPCKTMSAWGRIKPNQVNFWGMRCRLRIATQLHAIRHWRIRQASYKSIRNAKATWFVDPPYQNSCGRAYKFNGIDFDDLGAWCRKRRGQVIACEQVGADWLPFKPFLKLQSANGSNRSSREVIWSNSNIRNPINGIQHRPTH
jgi:site-specific DNA-adenine methylase